MGNILRKLINRLNRTSSPVLHLDFNEPIELHGSMCDNLYCLPYLKQVAEQNNRKLHVRIRGLSKVKNNEALGFGDARVFEKGNEVINPQFELLQNCSFLDRIEQVDSLDASSKNYITPRKIKSLYPNLTFTPSAYRPYLTKDLFNASDYESLHEELKKLPTGKKLVGFQFRRCADVALMLFEELYKDANLEFVVFGSSEYDPIPDILDRPRVHSYVDSYLDGFSVRIMLLLASRMNLFIGNRSAFGYYAWLSGTSALNIFDINEAGGGLREVIQQYVWEPHLWAENPINRLFFSNESPTLMHSYARNALSLNLQ